MSEVLSAFPAREGERPTPVRNSNVPLSLHPPAGKINGPRLGRLTHLAAKKPLDFIGARLLIWMLGVVEANQGNLLPNR